MINTKEITTRLQQYDSKALELSIVTETITIQPEPVPSISPIELPKNIQVSEPKCCKEIKIDKGKAKEVISEQTGKTSLSAQIQIPPKSN
ncbi:205_t:CDS:2 [Racocetra persica]|uniref:205_t:CDS:1 n=1 Tax=Racocetra persica TaxID=160502 RepID=A0ACA9Q811_9GLOM|nr:205_t:CDS:2 [Racocetra persica]